ncbi:hypothetical protein M378DRAFT_166709, partial [Amanita muscaria Koide BX008]
MMSLQGNKGSKPRALNGLSDGTDIIYYASSAKGDGTIPGNGELKIPTLLLDAFNKCKADAAAGRHNFNGKCAEPVNLILYRLKHGEEQDKVKMMVTVNNKGVMPPCSANEGEGTYGCKQLLEAVQIDSSKIIKEEEACGIAPPGNPKGSLGKRACRRPSKATKPTMAPNKGNVSKPKGAKPAPKKQTPARPVGRRPKHRRSVQPRWN